SHKQVPSYSIIAPEPRLNRFLKCSISLAANASQIEDKFKMQTIWLQPILLMVPLIQAE
ncbi:unnamed protein product, partial [Oikopleura dioica]